MASVNKVILIGNIGKDLEVKYTASGAAVCTATLATNRRWKNKATGEMQEETEWHRAIFYDKLAEVVGQYLAKGSKVYVEGRLHTRKWTDKEGVERYTTEIVCHEMTMLDGKQQTAAAPTNAPARSAPPSRPPARQAAADMDEDLPF